MRYSKGLPLLAFFCALIVHADSHPDSSSSPSPLTSASETQHVRRSPNTVDDSATALSLPLSKRAPKRQYRNLGVWRMILTATTSFYATKKGIQPSAAAITSFLSTVVADVTRNIAERVAETDEVEIGVGVISLAFRVKDGVGSTATVPWDLVLRLAKEFEQRAELGNPTGFRAGVYGPLAANFFGESPWIEVVLAVAGEVLMEGIPWSIH